MCIRLLIVEDSPFFVQRFKYILQDEPNIKIIAIAGNGLEAVRLAKKLKPDVISMDYAMPIMDGLSAVKIIMMDAPSKILMLSALSLVGAKITLEALDAGALDFLPKNELNPLSFINKINQLHNTCLLKPNKFRSLANIDASNNNLNIKQPNIKHVDVTQELKAQNLSNCQLLEQGKHHNKNNITLKKASFDLNESFKLLVIAASTGGPIAVQQILQQLPANFAVPIVVIQHMPAAFSLAFAQRLNEVCNLKVVEAKNGDKLQSGMVFVAPGGRQLLFAPNNTLKIIYDEKCNYHPCADVTFSSAADVFASEVLAIVLTGMGSDGMLGAAQLKNSGSKIWAQSKETCTIYGMPAAVINAHLSDEIYHLEQIAPKLMQAVT